MHINKKDITLRSFDKVLSTLGLCNKALTELNLIGNIIHTEEERKILVNHTFDFYKTTLYYCFNAEYCKLFQPGISGDELNIPSIVIINNSLYKLLGDQYESEYQQNKAQFSAIYLSSFYQSQLILKEENEFSNQNALSFKEAQLAFQHLGIVQQMLISIIELFNITYQSFSIPDINTSTIDFVMDHSVFKKFYFDHYMKSLD